jgi:hypothetical protein
LTNLPSTMFSRLLTKSFDSERLTEVEGTNKTEYTSNLSSQDCYFQPITDLENLGGNEKVGQVFLLFCDRVDIKVSDKITINEVDYIVKTINDLNFGHFPHLEAKIVQL